MPERKSKALSIVRTGIIAATLIGGFKLYQNSNETHQPAGSIKTTPISETPSASKDTISLLQLTQEPKLGLSLFPNWNLQAIGTLQDETGSQYSRPDYWAELNSNYTHAKVIEKAGPYGENAISAQLYESEGKIKQTVWVRDSVQLEAGKKYLFSVQYQVREEEGNTVDPLIKLISTGPTGEPSVIEIRGTGGFSQIGRWQKIRTALAVNSYTSLMTILTVDKNSGEKGSVLYSNPQLAEIPSE